MSCACIVLNLDSRCGPLLPYRYSGEAQAIFEADDAISDGEAAKMEIELFGTDLRGSIEGESAEGVQSVPTTWLDDSSQEPQAEEEGSVFLDELAAAIGLRGEEEDVDEEGAEVTSAASSRDCKCRFCGACPKESEQAIEQALPMRIGVRNVVVSFLSCLMLRFESARIQSAYAFMIYSCAQLALPMGSMNSRWPRSHVLFVIASNCVQCTHDSLVSTILH